MRPALAFPVSSLLLALAVGCGSPDTTPIVYNKRPTTKAPAPAAGETNAPTSDVPAAPATTPAPAGGDEIGTETWKDGKQIAANLTIKAGATVEIEPGATITVAAGVAITVKGTLSVKASADHADLAGANWKGIVVASGGTLAADGLDIADAEIGVWTMTGNAGASFLNSSIANAATPFKMEPGSKLSFTKSKVSKATGASVIAGTFTASYMDYDKGSSEGLELSDAAGTMTISDSTLHGLGGGDYVVSRAGKLVKVEYTTITGSHCGLHFDAVDQFIIDHVSDDQNSYGAMLYGSGAGPNQILSSNVRSTEKDLDMSGTNGALTIDKSFTGGKNTLLANAKITNAATAPITDAKPR